MSADEKYIYGAVCPWDFLRLVEIARTLGLTQSEQERERECKNCGRIARNQEATCGWCGVELHASASVGPRPAIRRQEIDENTSDGYHTFKELYAFRRTYNAVLFNEWASQGRFGVHKSLRHGDGSECFGGGWFVVMASLPSGQISNHYEIDYWNLFQCEVRERADAWDGHTADDVLERLALLAVDARQHLMHQTASIMGITPMEVEHEEGSVHAAGARVDSGDGSLRGGSAGVGVHGDIKREGRAPRGKDSRKDPTLVTATKWPVREPCPRCQGVVHDSPRECPKFAVEPEREKL